MRIKITIHIGIVACCGAATYLFLLLWSSAFAAILKKKIGKNKWIAGLYGIQRNLPASYWLFAWLIHHYFFKQKKTYFYYFFGQICRLYIPFLYIGDNPIIMRQLPKQAKEGKDTVLKLLLKYSRSKDFVQKLVELMDNFPEIFIHLSCEQAQLIYEYSACFTKRNAKNIQMMQTAFNKTYGKEKNTQFFSMLDYYLEEG